MILLAALMLLQQEAAPEILVTARPKPFDQTPATMVVEPVAMMIAACDADGVALRWKGWAPAMWSSSTA